MINWIKRILGLRKIDEALNVTKYVRLDGIRFQIKKIDVLDYLDGSKVLLSAFDTYKTGKQKDFDVSTKKIKDHYRDVLMSGVISPTLSRKGNDQGMFVDNLFSDWELAERLYEEIIQFSYGKKKMK